MPATQDTRDLSDRVTQLRALGTEEAVAEASKLENAAEKKASPSRKKSTPKKKG